MKISLSRKTRSYVAGDEVTAQIMECKESNGNLSFKLAIIENGQPSQTIFYHTVGAYQEKGRYYLELLLNHLNAPEDGEIGEKWFIGKKVTCILGSYTNPTTGKTYINLGSYVDKSDFTDQTALQLPFDLPSDVIDVDFSREENSDTKTEEVNKPKPKNRKRQSEADNAINNFQAATNDYVKLLEE